MKKSRTKKLVLSKTTVSRLDQDALARIRGGLLSIFKCQINEDTEHCKY